jgi:hypothetical protein
LAALSALVDILRGRFIRGADYAAISISATTRGLQRRRVMNLAELLISRADQIVLEAQRGIWRAHLMHYERDGEAEARERVRALYECAARAIRERHLAAVTEHVRTLAESRFASGFGLGEVQTAINAIEESLWNRITAELPLSEQAYALGLVSTVLGAAKDTLGRTYVTLASEMKVPSLNLEALLSR